MATAQVVAEQIQLIDLKDLEIHPANPRQSVGNVDDIVSSINDVGLLSPLIAVRHNGKYQVVDGSRRLAALRKAGKTQADVKVLDLSEAEAASIAIIANLQREDLDPLEEAGAYRKWLALNPGKTQKELSEKVGRAPSTIANALRLLDAPKPVADALREGRITAAHAKVALELKDPSLAKELTFTKGETVDDFKAHVDELNEGYALTGPGAIAAARKFLADTKAARPSTTITWKKPTQFEAGRVPDLVEALGECPTKWTGEISEYDYMRSPTAAQHDKVCDCHAQQIVAKLDYGPTGRGRVLKFGLERVCINEKKYRTAKPKKKQQRTTSGAKAKELTPAQIAKQEKAARDRAEKAVARELSTKSPEKAEGKAILARIRKGAMSADAARGILWVFVVGANYGVLSEDESIVAWNQVTKMPTKKVIELGQSVLAKQIYEDLRYLGPNSRGEEATRAMAAYFGIKLPEPKAKKKAKRG